MATTTYQSLERRYDRWTAQHPDEPDTTRSVVDFLATLTPASAWNARAALRRRLGTCVAWDTVPRVRYQRDEARLRATLLVATERATLRKTRLTPRDRALVEVCYVVRRAEAAGLRWRDIDETSGMVYVAQGKGGRAGWTALPKHAVVALRAWRTATKPPDDDMLVFPGADGEAHPDTIGEWVRRALQAAGIWHVGRGAHAFRRTFATEYLRTYPERLRSLQKLMRHRQISSTVLYDYVPVDELRGDVAAMRL
jgi:integrase